MEGKIMDIYLANTKSEKSVSKVLLTLGWTTTCTRVNKEHRRDSQFFTVWVKYLPLLLKFSLSFLSGHWCV